MKIILYKDVPNLGEEGDVKVVADGYARNFLLPQKFAVRYTKATEMELAQKQKSIARRKEEKSKCPRKRFRGIVPFSWGPSSLLARQK
jgi:large subunit ribosomal protein L9